VGWGGLYVWCQPQTAASGGVTVGTAKRIDMPVKNKTKVELNVLASGPSQMSSGQDQS